MVSFVCDACQDTIKKPKLEAVFIPECSVLMYSTQLGVMLHSLVLTAIKHFRGELGKTIRAVYQRNKSIRGVM
jgi:hypothetical protein